MRSGRLLTEDSPENLLRDYNLPSLENVFLKLCMKDEGKNGIQQQPPALGHDNMAFDQSASQSDVSEVGIDGRYTRNDHQPSPTSPADFSVVKYCCIVVLFHYLVSHFLFEQITQFDSAMNNNNETPAKVSSSPAINFVAGKRSRNPFRMTLPSRHRLSALILKNYLLIFRNLG